MDNSFDNESKLKYINILNRIHKKISSYEGFLIMKNQYFTDNVFYYFLCVIFRSVDLIYFSGDYSSTTSTFIRASNTKAYKQYIKILSCYGLMEKLNISYKVYVLICLIILILFIIRMIIIEYIIKKLNNYKNSNKWYIPTKCQIIYDHIIFLLFPFIIEYLSFIYYIFFFPDKFFIYHETELNAEIIFITIINTLLIICYNVENYANMIFINKIFTVSIFEAYKNQKTQKSEEKKTIAYRYSNPIIYIYIIIQNFVLILNLDSMINRRYKTIFKIIVSVVISLIILLLFFVKKKKYNYYNFINTSINVIILYCFYSMIIDSFLLLSRNTLNTYLRTMSNSLNDINDIIYLIIKLILAYITYLLYVAKTNSFLQMKVSEILFNDKSNKKEEYFINSFYYFHQILLKIKNDKNIESAFLFIKFLSHHIDKCKHSECNCELLNIVLKKNILINEESKSYISELLIILNYLFENAFVNNDFYKSFDLSILLAEHYCHIRNNPLISFSIIKTLMSKQTNKFNKFEMIILYELCQKYIYYISSKDFYEFQFKLDKNEILSYKLKIASFVNNYNILKSSYKIKKAIINYIDNEIKILKYKYIFEDSIVVQFDENEEISSVKINFFNEKTDIDNLYSNYDGNKENINVKRRRNNLYIIIYLLRKENYYYQKILKSINKIDTSKQLPIYLIFKYFLLFDFILGEKIPIEIAQKLYNNLTNKKTLYNGNINRKDYMMLKKKYKEQNNVSDSKFYVILEIRREITTKYFSEDAALKLGFKQKDIINEKMSTLMPNDFDKSHQYAIKQLLIGHQTKYLMTNEGFYFDKSNTILYLAKFEISLLYNLSKSLQIIIESIFLFDNKYYFMLDNNLELLANSKNFEDEYYLNKKILESYNIKIMDILKYDHEKLNIYFENEFNKIKYIKFLRQIKPEEYFFSQFNSMLEDKDKNFIYNNQNQINNSKNHIILKLVTSKTKEEILEEESINEEKEEDDDDKNFIKKNNLKKNLSELLNNPREIMFSKIYSKLINKGYLINNIAKELTKIPDNDLMLENDIISYNLIISAKKLISKLLTKNELANNYIKTSIKFYFFYDKPFYFITIDDDKKLYLKVTRSIHFENSQVINKQNLIDTSRASTIKSKNSIPYDKSDKKSRNKKQNSSKNNNQYPLNIMNNIKEKKNKEIDNKENKENDNGKIILKKIEEVKKKINKDRFISIIRIILSFIITLILILYISIIFFQKFLVGVSEQILFSYYFNTHTREAMLFVYSRVLLIYYDYFGLIQNLNITGEEYQTALVDLCDILKTNHYDFWDYFFYYNEEIGYEDNILLIYKSRHYKKLGNYWREINYDIDFSSEIDVLLYNIISVDIIDRNNKGITSDLNNFLFFKQDDSKINTSFIKLLYYLCSNYEFTYKNIFLEMEQTTYQSYKSYINREIIIYIILEIIGIISYILFFVSVNFYLFYSNEIIIKNIIFLFLDFTEEKNYNKNNNDSNNIINLKLIEFKQLMEDFDLNRFDNYSINIDYINNNKAIYKNNKINNNNNNETNNNTNNEKKNKLNKKFISKEISNSVTKKETFKPYLMNKFLSSKNSSTNRGGSLAFKDKLNNNSINASKDLLVSNNSSNYSKQNIENNHNTLAKDEIEKNDNFRELILNKSNKSYIFIIKFYIIIFMILFLAIIIFSIFKIQYTINFNKKYENFFIDFTSITNRYSLLYYYFNILRTLLLFPEGDYKMKFEKIMDTIDEVYAKESKNFTEVFSKDTSTYPETMNFFNLVMESKNNLTYKIMENICNDEEDCYNYLESIYNIFDSGIDFAYKTCINNMKNIYLDYQKLKNKTNITEINSTLINSKNSNFGKIGLALCHVFFYVQETIFDCFDLDVTNLEKSYNNKMSLFNIITIIFSIFIFLFVIIFMFITIWKYTSSIKDSTYRINCSFYYIKKYSLTTYRHS